MIQKLKNVIETYPAEVIFGLIVVAILATNVLLFATMSHGTDNLSEAILIAYVHNEESDNTAVLAWDTLNYRLVIWESQDYKHYPLKKETFEDGGVIYIREAMILIDGFNYFPVTDLVRVNDNDGHTYTVEDSYNLEILKEIEECFNEDDEFLDGKYCTNSGIWGTFMDMKKYPSESCISTYQEGMINTDSHIASGSYSKWPKTEIVKTFWGYQVTVTPYVDRVWLKDGIAIYRSNGDPIYVVLKSDEQLNPSDPRAQAIFAEANQLGIDWNGSPVSTFNVLLTGNVISTGCTVK